MSHFPTTPAFTGFNTPSRVAARSQFSPRLGDDISIYGDGMISRFPTRGLKEA